MVGGNVQPKSIPAAILLATAVLVCCACVDAHTETRIRGSVRLNGGARYTGFPQVMLQIEAGPEASEMLISENGRFEGAKWMPFRSEMSWTLSGDQGIKTLFMKLRGAGQQESDSLAASIFLDETPILNLVQPAAAAGLAERLRQVQIRGNGTATVLDFRLVFDDGMRPIYLDSLAQAEVWLPDGEGCLYLFGLGREPVVRRIEYGDATIAVPESRSDLKENQFWVAGCAAQGWEGATGVVLRVDGEMAGQAPVSPDTPFFRLVGTPGTVTTQLLDGEGNLLAQEEAEMAPAFSIDRTFIVELKAGHVEKWTP